MSLSLCDCQTTNVQRLINTLKPQFNLMLAAMNSIYFDFQSVEVV